jgi:hypothetical protein
MEIGHDSARGGLQTQGVILRIMALPVARLARISLLLYVSFPSLNLSSWMFPFSPFQLDLPRDRRETLLDLKSAHLFLRAQSCFLHAALFHAFLPRAAPCILSRS